MDLWHGTTEWALESILKDGCLKPDKGEIDEATVLINCYIGDQRKECIYFSNDKESADGYHYAFKINTDRLDLSKLYVADNDMADAILCAWHEDEGELMLKQLAQTYISSFISFEQYMRRQKSYDQDHSAEFLYFGEINVSERDLD